MKTEHKYAQVLRWIADGEQIEWWGWGGAWHPITTEAILKALSGEEPAPPKDFRLKPSTITVNGREIVSAESEAPKIGAIIFLPDVYAPDFHHTQMWTSSELEALQLLRGLVHLTKENAIAHAKAMLGID